jgi:hypothetical protein
MNAFNQYAATGRLPPGLGVSKQFLKVDISDSGDKRILLGGAAYDVEPGSNPLIAYGPLCQLAHIAHWFEEFVHPKDDAPVAKWHNFAPLGTKWNDEKRGLIRPDNYHYEFEHIEFTLLMEDGKEGRLGFSKGALKYARDVCNQLSRIFVRDADGKLVRGTDNKPLVAPYFASRWRLVILTEEGDKTYYNLALDLVARPDEEEAPDEEACAIAEALDELLLVEDQLNYADPPGFKPPPPPARSPPSTTPAAASAAPLLHRRDVKPGPDIRSGRGAWEDTRSYPEASPPRREDPDDIPF